MYNVQCTMYNVQCTMYNVQCTHVHLYNVHPVTPKSTNAGVGLNIVELSIFGNATTTADHPGKMHLCR